MAYRLPNFTNPDTGALYPEAYARVSSVELNKSLCAAKVQFDVYASQALRKAGKRPIFQRPVMFTNPNGGPALYAASFGAAPAAPEALPAAPTTMDDALLSQAYVALKNHRDTAAILAGAEAV